jgi:glucans biosynthesis protein C
MGLMQHKSTDAVPAAVEAFIARWRGRDARQHHAMFLRGPCNTLGVTTRLICWGGEVDRKIAKPLRSYSLASCMIKARHPEGLCEGHQVVPQSGGNSRDFGGGQRYYAMDSLRGIMMLVVVVFHATLPYTSLKGSLPQEADAAAFFDPLAVFLHSFQMPLFFILGGFIAALLCDRRGVRGLVRDRALRILLPLILGWLVLAPITRGADYFAIAAASSGSVVRGLEVLRQGTWIRWSMVFHLWFLIALLALYPCGLFLRWCVSCLRRPHLDKLIRTTRRFLASPWRPLALALIIVGQGVLVFMITNGFDQQASVSLDVLLTNYFPATFSIFFALGWVLYGQTDLFPILRRHVLTYIAIGFAALAIAVWVERALPLASRHDGAGILIIFVVTFSIMSAFMVFGLLGLFFAHCDLNNPVMRYLSEASYWIFLIHLPLLKFIRGIITTMVIPTPFKWFATLALVMPIVLLTYHFCVRFTVIGALLNGRKQVRHLKVTVVPNSPDGVHDRS